ncbi:MAG: hypothetical protein ACT4SY_05960 [Hyphomicrobiales bacterium]
MTANGLEIADRQGVTYSPFSHEWRRSRDMDVNYMVAGRKPQT